MRTTITILALGVVVAMMLAGCKSKHEKGLTTNYMEQWTNVGARVEVTTDAAKEVLEGEQLKDITSSFTAADGHATGKKADGTKVVISIKRLTDSACQLSLTVGALGEPKWGAELVKKIKAKAEIM